jgi:predicted DsbA family dithiol-disulfide isomerase
MPSKEPVIIEMYYTFTCPNCRIMKYLLGEVLPQFGDKFVLKKKLANSPIGMLRTMKLGIHAVPALLIDGKVIFRSVPSKEELINKLRSFEN